MVYVYINSWVLDSGEDGEVVQVFAHLDDALAALKEDMKEAREYMESFEAVETDYNEGDFSWSIYEDGSYLNNHINLTIYQRVIQ